MRLFARALFETVDLIGRHIVAWLFVATVVACATNATNDDPPPKTTTTGTVSHADEDAADAPLDLRPMLDLVESLPDGEPIPFNYHPAGTP